MGTEAPAPFEVGGGSGRIEARLAPRHDRQGQGPDPQGTGRTLLDFLLQEKSAEVALALPFQGIFLQIEGPGTGKDGARGAGEQALEGLLLSGYMTQNEGYLWVSAKEGRA